MSVDDGSYRKPTFRTMFRAVRLFRGQIEPTEASKLHLTILVVVVSSVVGAVAPIILAKILDGLRTNEHPSYLAIAVLMLGFIGTKALSKLLGELRWLVFNPLAHKVTYSFGLRLVRATRDGQESSPAASFLCSDGSQK